MIPNRTKRIWKSVINGSHNSPFSCTVHFFKCAYGIVDLCLHPFGCRFRVTWGMTPYRLVNSCRRFDVAYRLHLQDLTGHRVWNWRPVISYEITVTIYVKARRRTPGVFSLRGPVLTGDRPSCFVRYQRHNNTTQLLRYESSFVLISATCFGTIGLLSGL